MLPDYKQAYKVKRTVADLSDGELEEIWWTAFSRDKCGDVMFDPVEFRLALSKALSQ